MLQELIKAKQKAINYIQDMRYLPYNAEQLPKEEEDKALAAINESDQSRKVCLEKLRNKLKDKKFKPYFDEEFLLMYLRTFEFDCDRTAYSLQTFYKLVMDNPDNFETCVLDALPKAYLHSFTISPFRMKDNSLLILSRYFKTNETELAPTEKVYLGCISSIYLMKDPINQICGLTVLVDVCDFKLSKLPQYTSYNFIAVSASILLNSPVRIKKIHVVNISEAAITGYNTIVPLLPKKIVDMLHFHSDRTDFKDLHEFIPPEILPERYGGHLKECEIINGMKNIIQMEDYFRKYFPL